MKEKVVVIVGPTAVGKTKAGVELAKRFHGEIISGDSMQIYKGLDIGTAKITKEEMENIPHHLIDIKEPTESFSVAEFQQLVKTLITKINAKGKLPFIVGGTGLYISAVLQNYNIPRVPSNESYRRELEKFAKTYGPEALHEKLKTIDPVSYREIHPRNVRRTIRALEVYHETKRPFSEFQAAQKKEPSYDYVIIGLTMERKELYERINARVDEMIEKGLLEEVKRLYQLAGFKDSQAAQAIGYKEIIEHLEGKITLEEAIEKLKRNTRRYAKRQFTWFRNKTDAVWFDMTNANFEQKIHEIEKLIEGMLLKKAK